MDSKKLAESMGFGQTTINLYEQLIADTLRFKNNEIAELDIIYFLQNILWSSNFELIAKIIVDNGMESRLDQWKEAVKQLKSPEKVYCVTNVHLVVDIDAFKHLHQCCVDAKEAGYNTIDAHNENTGEHTIWEIDKFIFMIKYKLTNN